MSNLSAAGKAGVARRLAVLFLSGKLILVTIMFVPFVFHPEANAQVSVVVRALAALRRGANWNKFVELVSRTPVAGGFSRHELRTLHELGTLLEADEDLRLIAFAEVGKRHRDALVALLKNEMDVGQVARALARAEESHSRALQRLVGDELLLTRASGKKIEVAVRHAITHPGATHVDFCRAMRLCQIKQIWQQVQQLLDLEQACAADCQQATKNLEIEIKKAYAKAEIEHLAQESRLGRHTDAGISVAECIKTQSICDCLNAIEKVHCG